MKLIRTISHPPFFQVITLFFIFFSYSCEDKPLEAGLDILPEDDLLAVVDTILPVELFTISDEAVYTRSIGTSPLGSVNDPVTGILETDFITDFIYSGTVSFTDDPPDSVFLIDLKMELAYSASYGDSLDIDFNVYELIEPMPDYAYSDYQMFSHMYDHSPVNTGPPVKKDDTTSAYIVTIKDEFAYRLLDTSLINDEIYTSSNQRLFKEYFKGFYFAVEPREQNGGGIILVNHTSSKMILRTLEWNTDSSTWDTLSNTFYLGNPSSTIDSGGVHLNMYRGTMASQTEQVLNDTVNLSSQAYISALAGPRVLAKIPALEALREQYEGQLSVNFAHLVLPFDSAIYLRDRGFYAPPASLGLFDSGLNTTILDDELAENHLGGAIDTVNSQFLFNVGNHVHEYLRDNESTYANSFFVFAATGSPVTRLTYTPARIVLNGSTTTQDKPYLRIVYSIIPK